MDGISVSLYDVGVTCMIDLVFIVVCMSLHEDTIYICMYHTVEPERESASRKKHVRKACHG